MELLKYNNKSVEIIDTDGKKWIGRALYQNKEDYEEDCDALGLKTVKGWFVLFENEIESIEVID